MCHRVLEVVVNGAWYNLDLEAYLKSYEEVVESRRVRPCLNWILNGVGWGAISGSALSGTLVRA